MEIIHDLSRKQFQTVADGKTAYVSYDLVDGCLNIEHTIVPPGNRRAGYRCRFGEGCL